MSYAGAPTTVRSLADVFSRLDLRVLAIDADPQGNLSDYFDVDPKATPTFGDVLTGTARASEADHGGIVVTLCGQRVRAREAEGGPAAGAPAESAATTPADPAAESADYEAALGLLKAGKRAEAESTLRKALALAFDFEWTNKNIMYDSYERTHSYFQNSDMMAEGPPSEAELKLLEPFRERLPAEVFGAPFGGVSPTARRSRTRVV